MSQSDTEKAVVSGAVKRFLLNRLSELFGVALLVACAAFVVLLVTALMVTHL